MGTKENKKWMSQNNLVEYLRDFACDNGLVVDEIQFIEENDGGKTSKDDYVKVRFWTRRIQ